MVRSLAGVARADVTPSGPITLEGYHRQEPAHDVLDPLSVTALALSADGQNWVLILSVDHVGLLVAETDRLRRAAARASGIGPERVLVFFTHTHSAPRATPEYLRLLADRVAEAADSARSAARPARLGWGLVRVDANVNRRPRGEDGRAYHGVDPSGPVDRCARTLLVADERGGPLAVLLCYGAHGNVLRGDSNVLSTDWPGAARAVIEREMGCPAVVCLGACGNVNPRWRGSAAALRRMGWAVGGAALQTAACVEPAALEHLALRSHTLELCMTPLPDEAEGARLAAAAREHWGAPVQPWLDAVRRRRGEGLPAAALPLPLTMVRINEGVLGGIPMEPFAELGLAVAERLAGRLVSLTGCTNGWIGYLPSAGEYAAGGYEVDWAPIVYGVESGWLTPADPRVAEDVICAACRLAEDLLSKE